MKSVTGTTAIAVIAATLFASGVSAVEPTREDTVRTLSATVMPFAMAATTHVFTTTPTGGIQRVIAKNPSDSSQKELIRAHLKEIAGQFQRRDFSGPAHVHGADMPGLAVLRTAAPRDLRVDYRELPAGAEVEYRSGRPDVVAALHDWFAAQLTDHGADATAGHDHSMAHHP